MSDDMNDFEKNLKTAYKQQTESLDAKTLHHLRLAREFALSKQSQSWLPSFNLKWVTGAGAGLALATVLTFMLMPNLMSSQKLSPLDDIDMLTAEADLDLVTHMDFYQWINDSSLSENTL